MRVNGPYLNRKTQRRYVNIYYDDGTKKVTSYARHLMEQNLGRKLEDWEDVHHIDGNQLNDTIENLQVLSMKDHIEQERPMVMIELTCSECGKKFNRQKSLEDRRIRNGRAGPFCGKKCSCSYAAMKSHYY